MPNMRAVQLIHFGDVDGLEVRRVPRPSPGAGEVLVEVMAAGINPGETVVRRGMIPSPLPLGQGADLAGVVAEVGAGVEAFAVGDEVLGFCPNNARASQAEFALAPATNLIAKPSAVGWDAAGALFTAGVTAFAGVRAVGVSAGDVVAVSAATGGVGAIAVQLAKHAGATVLGIAGPASDEWLSDHGIIPVNYGAGLAERLRSAAPAGRIDAFLDFFGNGYVELAISDLGIAPGRVNTAVDLAALVRYPVKAAASIQADSTDILTRLAALIADGTLEIPISATYPLDAVREAFRSLECRHTMGKIVLHPGRDR